jgi:phosphomannomutase
VYSDKAKTNGVELAAAASNLDPQAIYTKYVEAYKKGVFNFIKEDTDSATGETVAHKYFSGGMAPNLGITDGVLKVLDNTASDEVQDFAMDSAVRVSAKLQAPNAAMSAVMTWNDINGDIERWLPLTKQVMVSDIDAILDMYRDYDYRYVKDSVKLSPAVVFIQTLVLAKMAIEKAKAAGISSRDVLVARDARKIEPELVDAEIAALRYAGLNVYFAGKNPNCVTSYSWGLQSHEWLMTIFDTASHVSQPNGVMDEEEFSKLGADGSTILRTLLDQGLYKQVSSGKVQIQQTMQETERLLGVLYSGLPEEKVKAIMSILSPDVIVRGRKVTQLRKPGGNLLSLTKKEIKQDSLRMVREFLGDKGKIDEMGAVKEGDLFQIDIEKDAIRFNTAVGLEAANNGSLYQLGVNIKQAADSKAAVEGVLARLGGNKPLKDLKIVVEGSNTPSGPLATKVFENLGAEVVGLNQEVKEISGLHQADPAIEKNREGLKRKIIETHAHFGIAFDLDGDRALILVPEWYKDGSIKTFHALAPDNLLGVLLPYLLNDWGYRASGKEQALIADVLGTYAVTMAALHNGVVMKRTDAGYVFLKAMKEVLEPLGFVVPVYGELSGHTWLHVSGEVENPVAVAVLFATIVSREMKKDDPNPVYHVYDERTPDKFTQSPRFQPFYHPKLLKWLAWHNDKEWNYVPGVNPPQAIIELGKHETVVRLTRAFPLGHEFKTSNGVYKVSYLDAYNDADDGLYRYVDIMFEKDGKFIGRVVVRASSNDPTFVMSYEAPISGISAEEAARNRVVAAGLVMKFMVNEGLAIFTRRQMREAMTWLGEGAREIEFNKYNLSFPAADYEEFTVQEAANARFSDAAMAAPERIDGLEILSTPEGKKAQFVKTQEAFLIKEMLTDINSLHYGIVQALSALKAGWSKADTTIHVPLFGYHGGRDTMEEKSPHRKIITQLIDLLFPNRPFVPVSGKPFRLLWLTGVFSLLTESNGVYSSSDFKQALTALKDSTEGVIAYLEANIDRAMETMPGGIDLNSQNMQMNAQGQKIDMQFDPAMIEQFKSGDFSGLTPVILNITPITNIRPLLGLAPEAVGGASAEATGISKAVRRESEV